MVDKFTTNDNMEEMTKFEISHRTELLDLLQTVSGNTCFYCKYPVQLLGTGQGAPHCASIIGLIQTTYFIRLF